MKKKEFLELLIKSYGLIPKDVSYYRTSGCDGAYAIGIGWKGEGIDESGECWIDYCEPDGFNMAVYEILKQAKNEKLKPIYIL